MKHSVHGAEHAARWALCGVLLLLGGLQPVGAQVVPRVDSLRAELEVVDGTARIEVLNAIAVEELAQDAERGVQAAREAHAAAARQMDRAGQAKALATLGLGQHRLGWREEARASLERAIVLYEDLGDEENVGLCYNRLGNVYGRMGRTEEAVAAFTRAIASYEASGEERATAHPHANLALLYWNQSRFAEALPHFQVALTIWKELDEQEQQAAMLNNIGTVYYQWGRYEQAVIYYRRSMTLREELGDDRGVALVLNNLGLIYQEWGELDSAFALYEDALDLVRGMEQDMALAYTLHNLGSIYRLKGAYETALDYFERSVVVYQAAGFRGGRVMNLTAIGRTQAVMGDAEAALMHLNEARTLARTFGYRNREAMALSALGEAYLTFDRPDMAISYYDSSLALAQTMHKRILMKDAYHGLSNAYEQRQAYEEALTHYRAYHALRDSLYDVRTKEAMADLEARYEAKQVAQENAVLRAAQSRDRMAMLLVSLLLGGAVLLALVLVRANRQKRETNRLLALSRDEVARQRDEQEVLVQILSHDLANVLGNTRSCLELMLEEPSLLHEFGPAALRVTNNGIDVITLVREMHALEDGHLELEDVALREAVEEASSLLRNQLTAKAIAIHNEVGPELAVEAERVSLVTSVLANVLTNAIKFSRNGQKVRVAARSAGGVVHLSVRDYGVGMPADVREHLFDLGAGASRPGTNGEKGHGFGLLLVKRFVEHYGGTVAVRSWEAHEASGESGTEVCITLQAASMPEAAAEHRTQLSTAQG